MKTTLGAFPQEGIYYITATGFPAIKVDGELREYHVSRALPRATPNPGNATLVSRFEFLAHLATREESGLYMLGDVAIAIRGFTGVQGWAFERDPSNLPERGNVRIAMRSERDAEGTQLAAKIERSRFVHEVCYGPPQKP